MTFDQNSPNYKKGARNAYHIQNTVPKHNPIPSGTIAIVYDATANTVVATPTNLDANLKFLRITVQDELGVPKVAEVNLATPLPVTISTVGLHKSSDSCFKVFAHGTTDPVNGIAYAPLLGSTNFPASQNFSQTFNN